MRAILGRALVKVVIVCAYTQSRGTGLRLSIMEVETSIEVGIISMSYTSFCHRLASSESTGINETDSYRRCHPRMNSSLSTTVLPLGSLEI